MNIPVSQYIRLLDRYLRPQRGRVLLLALLLTLGIAVQLYSPQVLRTFLDQASQGTEHESLLWLALLVMGLGVAQQLLLAVGRYVSEGVAWTATNELRADLADHCLRLDLSLHKARTPGEMVERIDGDVNALSNFFSQFMIDLLSNLVLMLGILALLFREDWRVGLAMTLFSAVTLYVLTALRRFITPLWQQERAVQADFYSFLGEKLAGTEDIRVSGATGYVMNRYFALNRAVTRAVVRAGMGAAALWSSSLGLFAFGIALAFLLIAMLWREGSLTLGGAYLIFHYTELLRRPMEQVRVQIQDLQRATASIGRVEELLSRRSRIQDGPGLPLPVTSLDVSFQGVSFAYEADDPVLSDLNFHIQPGRVVGLLGRTGSGKSTLARLLLRFYDPTAGAVRLGGVDLRSARLADLRRRVGFVTQDVQLFAATVRDNLTFFDPTIGDDRILAVLDELGLGPWLRSLPHGLETQIESGGGLSAGEAQLLAFGRVFLHDPGLVILDEASSRLDPATENLVERAVQRLLHGRTGIIIAHRLGTVQRADEIIILEQGRILEHGDRTALAAEPNSAFARLLRTGLEEVLA